MEALPIGYQYTFNFKDDSDILIDTDPEGRFGIGSTVWDCALVLSKYIETHLEVIKNKHNIIELGAGTGILGLVIAKLANNQIIVKGEEKTRITFTDKKVALPLLKLNVDRYQLTFTNLEMEVVELDWKDYEKVNLEKGDLILLSDCVHWEDLFESLINTIDKISTPKSRILLVYEQRNFNVEARFFASLSSRFRFSLIKSEETEDGIYIFDITKK